MRRLEARVLAAVAIGGAAALAAAAWLAPGRPMLLAAIAGALVATLLLARLALRPLRRSLAALDDGLRSFDDRDYGLRLVAEPAGGVAELVRLYNRIAEALHQERRRGLEREVLLETVLQESPVATLLVDPRDRVVYANRSARELLGGGPALGGRRFAEVLAASPPALAQAVAAEADSLVDLEVDGSPESFHVATRRLSLGGRPHRLLQLRRMTRELRRQEVAAWKRVIRTMSHEVNNSLAPIGSLARSSRRLAAERDVARLDAALAVVEERAAHLGRFLAGYAELARLPDPVKSEVPWAELVDELAALYPFRLAGDAPAGCGRFDRALLAQALINLLKNAHEAGAASPGGGEVVLELDVAAGGGARLRVLDRGPGMDDETLRQATLPFFTTKPGGSGLGLALAREIAEAHGGSLRLERRPGGGMAASLWLPA